MSDQFWPAQRKDREEVDGRHTGEGGGRVVDWIGLAGGGVGGRTGPRTCAESKPLSPGSTYQPWKSLL